MTMVVENLNDIDGCKKRTRCICKGLECAVKTLR